MAKGKGAKRESEKQGRRKKDVICSTKMFTVVPRQHMKGCGDRGPVEVAKVVTRPTA